jgi:hypothetical protein
MPPRPDGRGTLSEARLCEIAGVERSTRRKWVKRKLLHARPVYTEDDAVELAVLALLAATLGPTDAPVAWVQIRGDVMRRKWGRELDLIFDTQLKAALLTNDLPSLAASLRHGRPVRVVSLHRTIDEIRSAFKRVTLLG